MLPVVLQVGEFRRNHRCGFGKSPEALQVAAAYFGSRVFNEVTMRLASPS